MQIKKDELYQAILKTAENEFFKKGFKDASLRNIAKTSGTTIGNLYHYFDNKEALFDELVKGEYQGFIMLLNNHENMAKEADVALNTQNITEWRIILNKFIQKLSPLFTKRFYILMNGSIGTKYESVRIEFIALLKEHFIEHFNSSHAHCAKELGGVISEQILASILAIIRDYDDEDLKNELITEILLFTFIGVMGVLFS